MTDHNEQFIPEQVDEQIDQFTQNKQHPMNNFMLDIHIASQDHDDAFDRVWDNLLDHMQQAQKPAPIVSNNTHGRIHFMSQMPDFDRPKARSRFIMPFTLVSCIILAILVTGSAFAVFQSAHSQSIHNNNTTLASHNDKQSTSTPTPTATALPSGLCSMNTTESWYTLCTSHQYTMINQTQTVDNHVVTIYAGYADSDNIILAYGWSGTTDFSIQPLSLLSAQKGVIIADGGFGGSSKGPSTGTNLQFYSVTKVPQGTTTLNLTVDKGLFHFSLPFHPARVTTINQTQVSNGQFVTLESVSVSPTMTHIFLKGSNFSIGWPPAPGADPSIPPFQLTVGNWSDADHGRGFNSTATQANNDPQLPFTSLELSYSSSLINQKGKWTLTLRNDIVPGATNDIIFHFTA
ncbi:hypothetical protein ccbrp13_49760 [Ktedonobacteria bacterium brp13]|nr:hypothetical protein ccbrp13_49760 [Ktedonobacteria bacterium brp13]